LENINFNQKKRLLVVDALNMFLRAYIMDPSLSSNGQPIGGIRGFLQILNKLTRESKPDQIVVCWDGSGGSKRRKAVNKNYKQGRKPIRLNRDVRNLTESQEITNKIWQQTRLFEYLNETPIIQIVSDGVEADDVISFIVQHAHYEEWEKVIVSADRDFLQLLNETTLLYRPVQKEVLNANRVVKNYGIHPNNFALARAIAGDASDNLEGIRGVGMGTISKRFSFLKEERSYMIDELIEHCENVDTKLKCYESIIEGEKIIRENYKIMQLYSPSISVQQKFDINNLLDAFTPHLNKTRIRAMLIQDGFGEISLNDLFVNFKNRIYNYNKK
tara:strand:+ start:6872 stop:7861 length:990 start_codon:yes stop_codon:yes gene_type:complete